MKTKAAAVANKATVDEDDDEPKKIRSSRSKRRHTRRSSTESESPPRKHSKKPSKRPADKKRKRSKVSSSGSHRCRHSPSPSWSLCSSSSSRWRSSVSRSCSTSSSSSDRMVSPPHMSRSGDVKKRKGRGRDRERDPRRRKARRSTSSSSSGSSRSRSKSSKRSTKESTKDGARRDKIGQDYENVSDYFGKDEEALVLTKKGCYEIERYEKNVRLEKIENLPSRDANETEDILPAGDESPVAEDLELILRQKALENFRKFRAAAAMTRKTDNEATRKETLTDRTQNSGTKVAEARSAATTLFRGQASSLGGRHPTESPKSEDCGNGKSPWMQKSSSGMSHGAGSHGRILKNGDTGGPTQQEGSTIETIHSASQPRPPQDGRNSRSVMHRLVNTPGSASSVNQRLGSSAGVSNVNGAPRIKSVVSVPTREGHDDCSTTPQRPCENSAPVESCSEIRHTAIDINKSKELMEMTETQVNPQLVAVLFCHLLRVRDRLLRLGLMIKMVLSFRRRLSLECMMERQWKSATRSTYQRKRRPLQEGNCSAKNVEVFA